MKLFEMEGFLRGKCLPGDMKVNETNAEYLVRKFTELEQKLADSQREFRAADATIENMQVQVEKLAAENAGLKDACGGDGSYRDCPACAHSEYIEAPETPATDAFLAEVRAQGVEQLALHMDLNGYSNEAAGAREYAANLRKGAQS
ncbi:hypothetical protein ABKU27_07280 [Enterobacter hormaechei]